MTFSKKLIAGISSVVFMLSAANISALAADTDTNTYNENNNSSIVENITNNLDTDKDTNIDKDTNTDTDTDKDKKNTVTEDKKKDKKVDESKYVLVKEAQIFAPSVSSLKITWKPEKDREYEIEYETYADYPENITFVYPKEGLCYLTGLRVNSEYGISITPVLKDSEKNTKKAKPVYLIGHTPKNEVIEEFDYEDGWTNCFAGEKASGLTAMPSSGAIYGSAVDQITGTGIRRFDNGDYCCAMGTHYGYCNDRFLVELENGIQFTTRICDSKGYADVQDEYGLGRYHNFGGSGKCIIEFIWDDGNLPGCVAFSGSWGGYNWNGLNLGANIKSIQKLATW